MPRASRTSGEPRRQTASQSARALATIVRRDPQHPHPVVTQRTTRWFAFMPPAQWPLSSFSWRSRNLGIRRAHAALASHTLAHPFPEALWLMVGNHQSNRHGAQHGYALNADLVKAFLRLPFVTQTAVCLLSRAEEDSASRAVPYTARCVAADS